MPSPRQNSSPVERDVARSISSTAAATAALNSPNSRSGPYIRRFQPIEPPWAHYSASLPLLLVLYNPALLVPVIKSV